MKRSVIPALFACAALVAGGLACADDARLRRYELANLDTLELTLPPGWVDSVESLPPGEVPVTIEFKPAEGPDFSVFVTPQWSDPTDPGIMDTDALRESVREGAERMRPQAVEPSIEIRRLQGESGVGFYFSATDRAPKPEEFLYMTQGALQAGDLVLWFTILTNDGQETAVAEALAMLQAAVHRRTGADRR